MNNWSSGKIPRGVLSHYADKVASSIEDALLTGPFEWRISGSTHLEIRGKKTGKRVSLSTSRAAVNPVYAAKWRSFLRQELEV